MSIQREIICDQCGKKESHDTNSWHGFALRMGQSATAGDEQNLCSIGCVVNWCVEHGAALQGHVWAPDKSFTMKGRLAAANVVAEQAKKDQQRLVTFLIRVQTDLVGMIGTVRPSKPVAAMIEQVKGVLAGWTS